MSSPCWVDKVGPVLAYRTMHLNDVVSASSPMTSLDIKYSTHLVWVDDPASRVLLARAPQQWGKQAAQWIYVGFPVFTSGTTGQYLDNKGVDPNTWPELSRRFDRVQSRYVPPVSRKLLAFFPLPFFWFLGIRRSAWKRIRTELQLQQQMAWVEVTCIFIYIYIFAANCTSFIWNIGHTFFGSSRWCLSRSISCENYVSKYGVTYVED